MSKFAGDPYHWQRLSPWSILYFIGRIMRGMLDPNIIVFLAPVYGLYQVIDDTAYFILALGLGVPALIIGSAALQYLFFFFRLDDNNFHIKRGLLFKRQVDLPFYRIQDVHIDKPFYFKPLKLVSATLDTAGSSENEAVLAAVPDTFADDLREWIFSRDRQQPGADEAAGPETQQEALKQQPELVLTRTPYDIFVHGITNNKVWIILAALFPLIDRIIQSQWDRVMEQHATEIDALLTTGAHIAYGMVALLVLAVIILMMLLSVIGSFILLHGYALTRTADTLSRESGLLSRNQINLKIRRVQFIQIKQSLFDRLFSRFNLTYRQLDPEYNAQGQSNATFLVPSVTATEVQRLTAIAFPDQTMDPGALEGLFNRVSPRYILQEFFLKTVPLVTIAGVLLFTGTETSHAGAIVAALLVAGVLINWLRWYRWGYFQNGEYLFIRKGLLGKLFVIIPAFKLQQASVDQSYPMVLNRHAHFSFAVGLSGFRIPYLGLDNAIALMDKALYDIEASRKSWM